MAKISLRSLGLSALMLTGLGACVSAKPMPRPIDLPYTQIFEANFNDVWNATVTVLDNYSIIDANRESGLIRTEFSPALFNTALYEHPDVSEVLDQVRYKIEIKLSKGLVSQTGKNAVRVQITKRLERYGNLLTDWKREATDENEERIILYRIGQRLRVMSATKRARARSLRKQESQSSAPSGEQ